MKVLGIETSCDETAAAVVEDGAKLLSNVVASSVDLHIAYGGVVPEIAARSHLEVITPVIEQSLVDAGCSWDDIDAIAVTYGPGLIGSLLIGVMAARTLAITKQKPLYGVDHVKSHPYAAFLTQTSLPGYQLTDSQPDFPLLALIVSGGHTSLVLFENHESYKLLGQTADDAVGEAFDKVAKILGLPYPGGPSVGKAAEKGDSTSVRLPQAQMPDYYFSFSGLKTAVLRAAQKLAGQDFRFPSSKLPGALKGAQKADLAASFQAAAANTLVEQLGKAVSAYKPKSVVIAGGVAANPALRQNAKELFPGVILPDIKLCTDNAAMIASLGYFQASRKQPAADAFSLSVEPALSLKI